MPDQSSPESTSLPAIEEGFSETDAVAPTQDNTSGTQEVPASTDPGGTTPPDVAVPTESATQVQAEVPAQVADTAPPVAGDLAAGTQAGTPLPPTPSDVIFIPRSRVFGDTLTVIAQQKAEALTTKDQLLRALAATEERLDELAELEAITQDPEAIRAVELGAKLGIALR